MPTKTVGLLESLTENDEDEMTGALDPVPPISSTKACISRPGRSTATKVCRFTMDFFASFLRTEHGRQEKEDCGGTA